MEVTNIDITILSRLSAEILVDTHFPENTVVISFYDPDGIPLDYGVFSKNVLPVPVDDFQINLPQADRIAEFVSKAVSNGQDIICQCERGRNRSAACAAAILEYYFGNGQKIFDDEKYHPDEMIYYAVLNALEKFYS